MFYETNIYIFNFNKKNIFIHQNIFIQLFKFPDIDKFLFNKVPPTYPPAAPSLKTCQNVFLFSFNYNTKIYISIYIYMLTIDNIFTEHIIFILKLYYIRLP